MVSGVELPADKRLPETARGDIIKQQQTERGVNNKDVERICTLDRSIYSCVSTDITTEEVILTSERMQHIKERHPTDYDKYISLIAQAICEPDYILENEPKTALVLKEFQEGNGKIRLVLRLATSSDNPKFKNSILTMMETGEKKWQQNLRNKKILYKRKE